MNEVYEVDSFTEFLEKLKPFEKEWIEKVKTQLKENLFVGKPLKFDFFREKRLGSNRLYYFTNVQTSKALIVAYGSKKEQQRIIEETLLNKEEYLSHIH